MNRKLLIISPYFPPVNAADMQRVRMSLPFFESFGWSPAVMVVDEKFTDAPVDHRLNKSIPEHITIIRIRAVPLNISKKFGLGAIALRSLFYYWKTGTAWIKKENPDLIFFSTTQFPVLVLGRYWKWRFGCKIIYDIQDPWFNTYYDSVPKNQRPPKYWFSRTLNWLLEPVAMKAADGIVSVSQAYWEELQTRYQRIRIVPCLTLPFGAFEKDIQIASELPKGSKTAGKINIRYAGRGGNDMKRSFSFFLDAIKVGLSENSDLFSRICIDLAGTSYAPTGKGVPTFQPLAVAAGLGEIVNESTDRLPYYTSLRFLLDADIILIPGSDDPRYTASKIFPYLLTGKPIIAIFRKESSVVDFLDSVRPDSIFVFNEFSVSDANCISGIYNHLKTLLERNLFEPIEHTDRMTPYLARTMTQNLTIFFDKVMTETR